MYRLIALLVLLLCVGCDPRVNLTIHVYGDSNSKFEIDDLTAGFSIPATPSAQALAINPNARRLPGDSRDVPVCVACLDGYTLGVQLPYWEDIIEAAWEWWPQAPDAVVVMLGTNDMNSDLPLVLGFGPDPFTYIDTHAELADAIDRFMDALPWRLNPVNLIVERVPVVWVAPRPPAFSADRASYFYGGLIAAKSRWSNLKVIDSNPAWYYGTLADGIHYSLEGQIELGLIIVDTVRGG